ncbi:MAG: mandelate racemase [Rhodospirillales bacterium 20-64-7]|nr:MAG: mandelate racemase [Rhodospirillales bacterium 20-64-7]HQT77869.1 enolase C-terminal domain-like protein [Rhodopila sp.]
MGTSYHAAPITDIKARAYKVPTDAPEADGTFSWDSTTIVVVHVEAGGQRGLGFTYSDATNAHLITDTLASVVKGVDAFDIPRALHAMRHRVRNIGRAGLAATGMSAVDAALWDLKAKLLGLPLYKLLGAIRDRIPVYGSGGFTSYTDKQLCEQLAGWVERNGCRWVKMKVGSDPDRDPDRVKAVRSAIGDTPLFVDANGALSVKRARSFGLFCVDQNVRWFEEPVSSDDLAGLRVLRDTMPAPIEVAAGEYAYDLDDVRAMLEANAVDVQQADASRCCGISGFLAAGELCDAHHIDLSGHCAPSLHRHAACAVPRFRHLEYFHDHVRIESMFFDGASEAHDGIISPDPDRPGLGLELKTQDVERFAV